MTALQARPDGKSHTQLWQDNKLGPGTGSPSISGYNFYVINKANVLTCAEIKTGKIIWRMRLKGPNLERQVYKAGRNLPRKLRKDASVVLQALQVADHPKLSRMINRVQFDKAARNLIAHLSAIDPRDVAIGRLLTFLGKISAVLIVGFVLVVWYLSYF